MNARAWCATTMVSLLFDAWAAEAAAISHPCGSPADTVAGGFQPRVCLRVLNRAGLSSGTLRNVTAETDRIWRLNGVEIVYGGPDGLCPEGTARSILVYVSQGPESFVTRPSVRLSTLGATLVVDGKPVAVVHAFVDRAERLLEEGPRILSSQLRLAMLLGRVIAHEIGHVLLGTTQHSASGLMRANYEGRDCSIRPDAAFVLTTHERALVHRRLAERAAARATVLAQRVP
jgi:hypothetical protein